jgi:hypothetical protein
MTLHDVFNSAKCDFKYVIVLVDYILML